MLEAKIWRKRREGENGLAAKVIKQSLPIVISKTQF